MTEPTLNADTVAALQEAHEAIKALCLALITVKGTLDQPYSDRPEWTPWTRFVESAFHQGAKAEQTARVALGGKLMPLERGTHNDGSQRHD